MYHIICLNWKHVQYHEIIHDIIRGWWIYFICTMDPPFTVLGVRKYYTCHLGCIWEVLSIGRCCVVKAVNRNRFIQTFVRLCPPKMNALIPVGSQLVMALRTVSMRTCFNRLWGMVGAGALRLYLSSRLIDGDNEQSGMFKKLKMKIWLPCPLSMLDVYSYLVTLSTVDMSLTGATSTIPRRH